MTYAEQLLDPRWQKVRLRVMNRDKWKCRVCNDDRKQLQVHHLFYCGMAWEIDTKWLVTVCDSCHKKLEDDKYKHVEYTEKDLKRLLKTHYKQTLAT